MPDSLGFDDLIPQATQDSSAAPSSFDDLIPKQSQQPSFAQRAGSFLADQAKGAGRALVDEMGREIGAAKGAAQRGSEAAQEVVKDVTTPVPWTNYSDLPDEASDIINLGRPAYRAAKTVMDAFNVPVQTAIGALEPKFADPLGQGMKAIDPRYSAAEKAAETPEETHQRGVQLLNDLSQIPFAGEMAAGFGRGPEPAPASRFTGAPLSAEPSGAGTPPPESPPVSSPSVPADATVGSAVPPPYPTPPADNSPLAAAAHADALEAHANDPRVDPAERKSAAVQALTLRAALGVDTGETAATQSPAGEHGASHQVAIRDDGLYTVDGPNATGQAFRRPEDAQAEAERLSAQYPTAPNPAPNPTAEPAPASEPSRSTVPTPGNGTAEQPTAQVSPALSRATTTPAGGKVAPQYAMVDPRDINRAPAVFQYKESDDNGLTGVLRDAKTFEPDLSDPLAVYRDQNGKLWVVNGHQRHDLALRAQAGGQPNVQVPIQIYDAADGYTPEFMRAMGAVKNMAQGSGAALDAAKVMRAPQDWPNGLRLPEIPPSQPLVRAARGLAALSDEAFGMATNDIVPPEVAAEVGHRIADPGQQMAALEVLAKADVQRPDKAAWMVDDMIHSGFFEPDDQQPDLPGVKTSAAKSLLPERARVIMAADQVLGSAASTFGKAIKGEGLLTGAGNALDRESNLKGKADNERLRAYLDQAKFRGPLSSALDDAAKSLGAGQSVKAAASGFLAKARALLDQETKAGGLSGGPDVGGDRPQGATETGGGTGQAGAGQPGVTAEAPYRPTEADGQNSLLMRRGAGGDGALRRAMLSGDVKRGAQAVIDRMRLQAGLDEAKVRNSPDSAPTPVDRADIREVEDFIDFIGHHMFKDVGLRIIAHGPDGVLGGYNAYKHVVIIFRKAIADGTLPRTAVHELWHSLERVLPSGDRIAVTREFQRQQTKWLRANPWARPFLYNGELEDLLSGAKAQDWLAKNRDDKAAMDAVKVIRNDKGQDVAVQMKWTPENYRFKNRSEYFAETMADKYFHAADLQDARARSVFGHIRALFERMRDGLYRLFGRDQTGRIFDGFRDQAYAPVKGDAGDTLAGHGVEAMRRDVDQTDQGDQRVMPGMERSAKQAAQARGQTIAPKVPQKPANQGLFAPKEPPQPGLFDRPAEAAKPEPPKPVNPNRLAADAVIKSGKGDGNEHLISVDARTGALTHTLTSGKKSAVTFSQKLIDDLSDPNAIIVIHHNHPSASSLSTTDVTMMHNPGLKAIVAHTHDGEVSIASLTPAMRQWVEANQAKPTGSPNSQAALGLNNTTVAAWNAAYPIAVRLVRNGIETESDMNAGFAELINRGLHKGGLIDYVSSHDTSFLKPATERAIIDAAAQAVERGNARYGFNIDKATVGGAGNARGPARSVRPDQGIAGLPGSDVAGTQAAPAGAAHGAQPNPASPGRPASGPAPIPDKKGQYKLLEQQAAQALREDTEARDLFASAAADWAKGNGPFKYPVNLARALGKITADSVVGRTARAVLAPGAYDDLAKAGARTLTQVLSQAYTWTFQAEHALRQGRDLVANLPRDQQDEFAMALEEKRPQATPELQKIADALREQLDQRKARLQSLGKLQDAVESYVGRIWKPRGENDPVPGEPADANARKVVAALTSKQPMTGSASFLKRRVHDSYRDALASDLEPMFDPVTTQLYKIAEMDKFWAGTIAANWMKKGPAKFFAQGADHGDLVKLEGPEFTRAARDINNKDGTVTHVPAGSYYAPEGVARVFNNYQSRGLEATEFRDLARAVRKVSNAMNSAQLGLSFFHPVFTSIDSQVSRVGIGIDQAMRGEFGKGAVTIAKGLSPTNVVTNLLDGDRMMRAIADPKTAPPAMRRLADAFAISGGRVRMDAPYRLTDEGAFKLWKSGDWAKAIRQANAKYPASKLSSALNVAGRALESISAPIMEEMVPRQKLGVFVRKAQDWMDSHPEAGNAEFVAAMQDIWASVDNRLGQMVYDNIFWNKTMKDLAFLTTRSVGWNMGSIREIGGGAADWGKFALDAAGGRSPEWTGRMSYVIALPLVTGAYGAMLQYLFTGQGPQQWLDYFYPKTGLMRPDGSADRLAIPTYMKDIFAYASDPVQTLKNKASPMLSFLSELADGKDYMGDLIADKDDPVLKQVGDVLGFAASQFMPFSIQGTKRLFQERPGPMAALGMFGVTPAPAYITNPATGEHYAELRHKRDVAATRKREAKQQNVQPLRPMPLNPGPLNPGPLNPGPLNSGLPAGFTSSPPP